MALGWVEPAKGSNDEAIKRKDTPTLSSKHGSQLFYDHSLQTLTRLSIRPSKIACSLCDQK
jgi:hypothetical protein